MPGHLEILPEGIEAPLRGPLFSTRSSRCTCAGWSGGLALLGSLALLLLDPVELFLAVFDCLLLACQL